MLKDWHMCTSTESNLRDRVWGEVESNSLIALPGKEWQWKTMCSNPGEFDEEIYGDGSRIRLQIT